MWVMRFGVRVHYVLPLVITFSHLYLFFVVVLITMSRLSMKQNAPYMTPCASSEIWSLITALSMEAELLR
jgi:hypothetical protein